MTIMRILAAGLLWVAVAGPAPAAPLPLTEISAYLNSLDAVESPFTQINDDGTISTGRLYMKRPGRVRFEYDPPEETLVVADGATVGVVDGKSNQGTQGYPLAQTPLKIILARRVDLTRERMVTDHAGDETRTTVTAQDPDNPGYGNIELVFTGDPVELRQWVINDGGGSRTTVILGALEEADRLDPVLFEIPGLPRGGVRSDR